MIDLDGLHSFFHPTSIAVVGASDQPGSVGQAVYANLKGAGFPGQLIPVNLAHSQVQGDASAKTLDEVPGPLDLVVVCTPARTVPELAEACGRRRAGCMVVISAGFRETGAAGLQLEQQLRGILNRHPSLRMVGPNCLGVISPFNQLNASFAATLPNPGRLAVISQSGALCTAMLDWSRDRDLGFSGVVSVGNMLDVGMGDLVDYFAADERTSAILLYLESLTDSRHFLTAARACTRRKPIIAFKAGRFTESSHAATSHTGAMAGVDAVYDAAFRRAGIERVFSFDDLFDCAKLLGPDRPLTGPRVAIITNAGGPGIMATDAWLAQRGQLAKLSSDTVTALNRILPSHWSHGNPVDVLGDAQADRYSAAVDIVAQDPGVDSVIVILTPQSMTNPTLIAQSLIRAPQPHGKPLLAVWMGGPAVRPGRQILESAHIPVYVTPEQAANALAHLVAVGRLREQASPLSLLARPQRSESWSIPASIESTEQQRNAKWSGRLQSATGLLGEVAAKELLADYGIATVPTGVACTSDEAADLAEKLGYPVVLKVLSPDISHKTDVGGVELGMADRSAVKSAYQRILTAVSVCQPQARVDGVTVQPMLTVGRGVELLLGATRDPIFGPAIVVGSGGVTAEIQHDIAMQLPPLSERRVQAMLRDLRMYPILEGFRGRPGVNLKGLTDVMLKFSRLVEERPELQAVEINPLLVSASEVVALDARVVVNQLPNQTQPGSHLAVCPYPSSAIHQVRLPDGRQIRVRPIRLDDETLWLKWLQDHPGMWPGSSRFPQRACSLDYDCEMLLVAEDADRKWLGILYRQRHFRTGQILEDQQICETNGDDQVTAALTTCMSQIMDVETSSVPLHDCTRS